MFLALIIKVIEFFVRLGSSNMDVMWASFWFWELNYFMFFTIFTFCVLIILRPREDLKLLSEIEELLDETL